MRSDYSLGAAYLGRGLCRFKVWAPRVEQVEVHFYSPRARLIALDCRAHGYHEAVIREVEPGSRYMYWLDRDGKVERPDPASRFQPAGVHGPSEVCNPDFTWSDGHWFGRPLADYIVYEIHVGTFTPEGTFDTVAAHLAELKGLGITAVELMPVAQFPGDRNWGYDGVYPFAVQDSYGGPQGLKRLVNECHRQELSVILDVVYNHLGPEGNYLRDFGPYFTDRYKTPWGPAINFDGEESAEVRRYFVENAIRWITEFHIDALRLDAAHEIYDCSAPTFLEELASAVHACGDRQNRRAYVIAESDRNDARFVRAPELGGYGLDAQWSDDFHHSLHCLLTGEQDGYYQDFGEAAFSQLIKSLREGFVYSGQYSAFRRRPHGNSSRDIPGARLFAYAQNHDQVGNRMSGERLSRLVSFEELKLAAGAVLLSPFLPLLFMGEEYGETAPFQYFVSHSDEELIAAVRRGRKEEFSGFVRHVSEFPDPQAVSTFLVCKLNHKLKEAGRHALLDGFYRELIRLRRQLPTLAFPSKDNMEVTGLGKEKILSMRRWRESEQAVALLNFGEDDRLVSIPVPPGLWTKLLDSAEPRWGGTGSPVPHKFQTSGDLSLSLCAKSLVILLNQD